MDALADCDTPPGQNGRRGSEALLGTRGQVQASRDCVLGGRWGGGSDTSGIGGGVSSPSATHLPPPPAHRLSVAPEGWFDGRLGSGNGQPLSRTMATVSRPQPEAMEVCCECLTLRIDSVVTSGQQVFHFFFLLCFREAITVALAPLHPGVDERKIRSTDPWDPTLHEHTHIRTKRT